MSNEVAQFVTQWKSSARRPFPPWKEVTLFSDSQGDILISFVSSAHDAAAAAAGTRAKLLIKFPNEHETLRDYAGKREKNPFKIFAGKTDFARVGSYLAARRVRDIITNRGVAPSARLFSVFHFTRLYPKSPSLAKTTPRRFQKPIKSYLRAFHSLSFRLNCDFQFAFSNNFRNFITAPVTFYCEVSFIPKGNLDVLTMRCSGKMGRCRKCEARTNFSGEAHNAIRDEGFYSRVYVAFYESSENLGCYLFHTITLLLWFDCIKNIVK